MTIQDFIKQTKVHLTADGENLTIPFGVVKSPEEREDVYEFARNNKPAIVAMLQQMKRRKDHGKDVAATVRVKIINVMKAWDRYLYEERQYLASNCTTDKPVPPEIEPAEALASLDEQELAYYTASVYAKSTDIEKARLGELAMMDIAEASFGFKNILARMKQDYTDLCQQRERDAEEEMERRAELSENASHIQTMRMTG